MVFSRTITAPTNLREQVDREATTLAMFMKYSSQEARSGMGISTKKAARDEPRSESFSGYGHSTMSHGNRKVVLAAMGGNAVITVAKFTAAALSGSAAMLAESVHSLADTANQALLLLGSHLGKKSDPGRYPLGRSTEVYFWSFVVAMTLFLLGGGFAIYEGVHKLVAPPGPPPAPLLSILVLGISVACEATSFTVASREFRRQRAGRGFGQALFAGKDPTVPIVLLEDTGALIGLAVALAAVGASWLTGSHLPDAIGSIVIGALLCVIGFLLARDTKSLLIGEAATADDRRAALAAIAGTPGVEAVTQMLTYHLGPDTVLLALKIRFRRDLSVDAVERAVDDLEARVRAQVPVMKRIFVEPDGDYREPPTGS
jgi:cation diffusion facilitator family transporter